MTASATTKPSETDDDGSCFWEFVEKMMSPFRKEDILEEVETKNEIDGVATIEEDREHVDTEGNLTDVADPFSRNRKVDRIPMYEKKDILTRSVRSILFAGNDELDVSSRSTADKTSFTSLGSIEENGTPDPADILRSEGKYQEALALYKETLEKKIESGGTNHPDTAVAYSNIADILFSLGKYDEAMDKYQKALKIRIKMLGWDNESTANTYNSIANILQNQGNLDGAMRVHQLILSIRLKKLDRDHPDLADSYTNIACLLCDQGKLSDALDMFRKALAIRLASVGPDHADTAATHHGMGTVYKNQGKTVGARESYQKALEIRQKCLGLDHPDTIKTQELLDELDN